MFRNNLIAHIDKLRLAEKKPVLIDNPNIDIRQVEPIITPIKIHSFTTIAALNAIMRALAYGSFSSKKFIIQLIQTSSIECIKNLPNYVTEVELLEPISSELLEALPDFITKIHIRYKPGNELANFRKINTLVIYGTETEKTYNVINPIEQDTFSILPYNITDVYINTQSFVRWNFKDLPPHINIYIDNKNHPSHIKQGMAGINPLSVVRNIQTIPAKFDTVILKGMITPEQFKAIPKHVNKVVIEDSPSLSELPEHIDTIILDGRGILLSSIKDMPYHIKEVWIKGENVSFKDVRSIPKHVKTIGILDGTRPNVIENALPSTVNETKLLGTINRRNCVNKFKYFPPHITTLGLVNASNIIFDRGSSAWPNFPKSIHTLKIYEKNIAKLLLKSIPEQISEVWLLWANLDTTSEELIPVLKNIPTYVTILNKFGQVIREKGSVIMHNLESLHALPFPDELESVESVTSSTMQSLSPLPFPIEIESVDNNDSKNHSPIVFFKPQSRLLQLANEREKLKPFIKPEPQNPTEQKALTIDEIRQAAKMLRQGSDNQTNCATLAQDLLRYLQTKEFPRIPSKEGSANAYYKTTWSTALTGFEVMFCVKKPKRIPIQSRHKIFIYVNAGKISFTAFHPFTGQLIHNHLTFMDLDGIDYNTLKNKISTRPILTDEEFDLLAEGLKKHQFTLVRKVKLEYQALFQHSILNDTVYRSLPPEVCPYIILSEAEQDKHENQMDEKLQSKEEFINLNKPTRTHVSIHYSKLNDELIKLAEKQSDHITLGLISVGRVKPNMPGHDLVFYVNLNEKPGEQVIFIDCQSYNGKTNKGDPIYFKLDEEYNFDNSGRAYDAFYENCFIIEYFKKNSHRLDLEQETSSSNKRRMI